MDKLIDPFEHAGVEQVYFEYSPTFGGLVSPSWPNIPASLSCYLSAHGSCKAKVRLTSKRISLIFRHGAESFGCCYSSLRSIAVVSEKVRLSFNHGGFIQLHATRPHLIAVQLWFYYVAAVISGFTNINRLDLLGEALSMIRNVSTSTLKVPGDFFQAQGDTGEEIFQTCRDFGVKMPINSSPYIHEEALLAAYGISSPSSDRTSNSSVGALKAVHRDGTICLPITDKRVSKCLLWCWYFEQGVKFTKGDKLFRIKWGEKYFDVYADIDGQLDSKNHHQGSLIAARDVVATVKKTQLSSGDIIIHDRHREANRSIDKQTTGSSIQSGEISIKRGQLPQFRPSSAEIPVGFSSTGSIAGDFEFAINNPETSFQSFFNDQRILSAEGFNDDIINLPCFDEDLYSRLAKEMHRYTLSEVADQKEMLAKKKANLGTFVGSLLGVFTMNPLAPFLGRNLGRMEADRGKRVEEFLPDPHLLFYQDDHSYLSWSRAQVLAPRLRRILLVPMRLKNGNTYFRLLPAIVTPDSIYPIQLFKIGDSSYFYRPFASGIEREQHNYDAVKVLRRYTHARAEGKSSKLDFSVPVYGGDIEEYLSPMYSFAGNGLDYLYADFKILPGSIF